MFTMDGTQYSGLLSLARTGTVVSGENSGEARDGTGIYDILGTRYGYTLTLDADGMGADAYDAFYRAVTAPQEGHSFVLPFGQSTIAFTGHVEQVTDKIERYDGQTPVWGALELLITPVTPQRRPGQEDDAWA